MDPNATPASRFNELPSETQEFLSKLQKEDIALLGEGLKLVRAMLTVGSFLRWTLIGFLAILMFVVSLWETISKILLWVKK